MPNENFPTINGIAPSWADVSFRVQVLGGSEAIVSDIAGISWADPVEIGEQRGAGGRVIRRTTGTSTPTASMTLYKPGWRELTRVFAAHAIALGHVRTGIPRIGLVHFDIVVHHTPPNEEEIYKTKIIGCRIMDRSQTLAEGNDPDKVEVPLSTMEIHDYVGDQEFVLV